MLRLRVLGLCLLAAVSASAQTPPPPPANPLLVNHTNWFLPAEVWDIQSDARLSAHVPKNLDYKAYSAVGYNLANTIAIVGPKGIVIIDTLGDRGSVIEAIKGFRAKGVFPAGKLPIRAIIYTHNHIDHIGGVREYLDAAQLPACPEEARKSAGSDDPLNADSLQCVTIIGQEKIVEGVNNTATVIGTMINTRSGYMYGSFLPPNWLVTNGIGYKVEEGKSDFVMPSRTFSQHMTLTAAGVTMELIYVPSETDDELAVFIPDQGNGGSGDAGLLQSAEVIQGPSFPNLYSLRGTSYRNPATWFRSVDKLRLLNSWCMLPSHGTPLCGSSNIQTLLRNFRDAIQYTHDQSVRSMNKGYTMQQIPQIVTMPDYLIDDLSTINTAKGNDVTDPKDYLRAFYGSVSQSVRELYVGYLGWFQADPVGLSPTPQDQYARQTVAMMGGRDKVLGEANAAYNRRDYQWSAEMASLLVTSNTQDAEAREAKAKAFVKLAEPQTNPNWRNWYLVAANELRGIFPLPTTPAVSGGLTSPGIVDALPYATWVNQWTMRLKAEETIASNTNTTLGFHFAPTAPNQEWQGYVLEIRRGICEVIFTGPSLDAVRARAKVVLQMDKKAESALIYADVAGKDRDFEKVLGELIRTGAIKAYGGTEVEAQAFFRYFDPPLRYLPPLAAR